MASTKKNLSYGLGAPLIDVFASPIVAQRAPKVSDKYEIGQVWINQPTDDVYVLTSIASNNANWVGTGGGTGAFDTVTAVTTIASGTTVTAGTNLVATSLITAGLDIVSTGGDFEAVAAGKGLVVGSGSRVVDYNGDPNGVVTAPIGSLCMNLAGSGVADRLWVNSNSATTWISVTTAS